MQIIQIKLKKRPNKSKFNERFLFFRKKKCNSALVIRNTNTNEFFQSDISQTLHAMTSNEPNTLMKTKSMPNNTKYVVIVCHSFGSFICHIA